MLIRPARGIVKRGSSACIDFTLVPHSHIGLPKIKVQAKIVEGNVKEDSPPSRLTSTLLLACRCLRAATRNPVVRSSCLSLEDFRGLYSTTDELTLGFTGSFPLGLSLTP